MTAAMSPAASRQQHYEALTDDEKYLAAILMDECGLDIAEFAWIDDTKEHRCYRAYHYQWRWWRCPDDQQLDQCIAAGQQVLTSTGYVPIEEVNVGDLVATHLGRFRPVIDIHDNDVHPVVTVDAGGHTVKCTHSHAFHVLEDGRHVWRSPAEFGPDTQLHIREEGQPRRWAKPTVTEAGLGRVYNLTVEDDHSYIVDGVVVKNCGRSVGKALDVRTPVPTPTGWSTMGALKVGDKVYDETGQVCTVTEAFDVMEGRPCYEVVFDDGSMIVADANHRWLTWTKLGSRAARRNPTQKRRGGATPAPAVRTTSEILATLRHGAEANHRVPVAAPLEAPDADLLIPPYTLGAWLGDGSSYRAHITAAEQDGPGVIANIEADGFHVIKLTGPWAYGIAYPHTVNHKTGTVTAHLRRLGVRANKHIPAHYLRASFEQRLALLQGLMDTDGHVTNSSRCEITLKVEALARDVYELALSLGQKPYIEKRTAYCNGVDAGPVYRVGFRPAGIVPFRLERKAARVKPLTQPNRVKQRRITAVRPVESRPVRCIAVDSASHLFLAGPTMIPTHNSERIKARVSAFPFNHAGEEMVLIAPEGKHIDAITDRIEPMIRNSRLMTYMLQGGSWSAIKHRPFKIQFVNCWFKTALPGRQGTGVKGIHPSVLEVDEGQDVSDKTWAELPEVLREDIESKKWLIHGVSNGRRDKFYDYSHDGDFTVHRFFGYHRPDWTAETKAGRLKKYGGTETSMDYRRNVLGEHGEQMNVIFVQSRLMHGVDDIPGSDYNSVEYMKREIDHELVVERAGHRNKREDIAHATDEQVAALLDLVQFPMVHLSNYPKGVFWAGLDYGLVDDPTEIVVAVEYLPSKDERRIDANRKIAVPDEGVTRMKVLTRIQLNRIPNPMVAALIVAIIDFYRPRAFSLDGTGIGLPLYQTLQAMANRTGLFVFAPPPDASESDRLEFYAKQAKAESTLSVVKSYNFSSKVFVGFDEKKLADLMAKSPQATIEDQVREAGIFRYVKDWATDILRDQLVNERRLNLPDDSEITTQMNGQSWGFQQEPMDAYGNRRMSYAAGEFHILDAMRMLALGWGQQAAERLLATKPKPRTSVLDYFG